MSRLVVTPITLAEANAFVAAHHRHHKPVPGAKFCVGRVTRRCGARRSNRRQAGVPASG